MSSFRILRIAGWFAAGLLFLLCAAPARAEGIRVEFPTGGFFRSGQVMPVVVVVETFGNRVEYNITLTPAYKRAGAEGPDVILEGASVPPRSVKRFGVPVILDSRTPGLSVRVIDELSMTRETVFSEDLSPRVRYLSSDERLFVFTGDRGFACRLMKFATLPQLVVKSVYAPPDSPLFSCWQFLEGVDCVVAALPEGETLPPGTIEVLRLYLELGGRVILASPDPASAALALTGLDAVPAAGEPCFLASKDDSVLLSFGLGALASLRYDPGSESERLELWKWASSEIAFPAAPLSLLPPEPDARLFEPVVKTFFSPMDMAPSYRRTLALALATTFLGFLLIAALLSALGLGRKGIAVFLVIGVTAVVLAALIHYLIPKPGVVWRYRSVLETDGCGRGRLTVFTSLAATSEEAVTLEEEPSGLTKIFFSRDEVFPLAAPRTKSPAAGWRIRGIPVLPRRSTLLMTEMPLSLLSEQVPDFLASVLSRETSELTTAGGRGFRRRFIQVRGDEICLGAQCITTDDFLRRREPPEGFEPGEWAFLHIACFRCSRADVAGNLYWPLQEPGEMVRSDRIMRIDFRRTGELGATLVFAPAPAEQPERTMK